MDSRTGIRNVFSPRRVAGLGLGCLLVLAGIGPAGAVDFEPSAMEVQSVGNLRTVILALEAFEVDNEHFPDSGGEYVPADMLRSYLEPVYVQIPVRDGWGNDFLYYSDGTLTRLVSTGPDGIADRSYTPDFDPHAPATGDDLVWADGDLTQAPEPVLKAIARGKQKLTMADMRSIATACEAFNLDEGRYPGPTEGWQPLEVIRLQVEPIYIRNLPLFDGWGHTILFWSDGEHYRIISPGRDGSTDRPFDEIETGTATGSFDSDIVFADGQFIQWPEGPQN